MDINYEPVSDEPCRTSQHDKIVLSQFFDLLHSHLFVAEFRKNNLKKKGGNRLSPRPFDVEENNEILDKYYDGTPFWVRGGQPTDEEAHIVPGNFGTIRIMLKERDWQFVTEYVDGLTFGCVKERCKNRRYKMEPQKTAHKRAKPPPGKLSPIKQRKAFVDENIGRIFRSGGPAMNNSKHNPSTPGMTWYLVRILP